MRIALIFVVLSSLNWFTLERTQNPIPANRAREAKALFKKACVRCHGTDGRGDTTKGHLLGATDLTTADWHQRVDDPRLINSITHGRGLMPGFQKKLSKDQIELLALYIRTFESKTK